MLKSIFPLKSVKYVEFVKITDNIDGTSCFFVENVV